MQKQQSWFAEHPWMTFFLAGAAINGVVYIVRGPPKQPFRFGVEVTPGSHPSVGRFLGQPRTNGRGSYGR